MRPPRLRTFVSRALLVIFGVVIAAIGGEILARMLPAEESRIERPPPRHPLSPTMRKIRTVFELAAPNIEGVHSGRYFRNNSAGFRGREYTHTPPPGVFRIAVTGDSVTMGSGVEQEDTYAARLEEKLNQEGTRGLRFEVLNLGLAGSNAAHAIDRLEKIGMRFQPHLVIYGVTINDLEGPFYRQTRIDSVGAAQRAWIHRFDRSSSHLLRFVWPRAAASFYALFPRRGTYLYEALDNWLHSPDAARWFARQLRRLAQIASQRKICAVVFIHPALTHLNALHPFHPVYRVIRRSAERQGLFVVDAWAQVKGHTDTSLWVSAVDSHPNEQGHELLARGLYDGLRQLPGRCWELRS